jgi:hypothetical protein
VRRIGVLMNAAATEMVPKSYVAAFVQALRQLAWTEGQNFASTFAGTPVTLNSRVFMRRSWSG